MEAGTPYKIFFISDSAVTLSFGNLINEETNRNVIALFNHLRGLPPEGMIEAVPAYSSVTLYFDITFLKKNKPSQKRVYEWILDELGGRVKKGIVEVAEEKNLVRIPVCYEGEFAIDLSRIAEQKNISAEEIIRSHYSRSYRVYMLGFLPGFAYMGEVDEKIATPRKPQPQPVLAGSVGIAGKQTGIYPLNSPGGWQIIGRTPLKMFDKDKKELCLLKAGDLVEFYPISRNEFENH